MTGSVFPLFWTCDPVPYRNKTLCAHPVIFKQLILLPWAAFHFDLNHLVMDSSDDQHPAEHNHHIAFHPWQVSKQDSCPNTVPCWNLCTSTEHGLPELSRRVPLSICRTVHPHTMWKWNIHRLKRSQGLCIVPCRLQVPQPFIFTGGMWEWDI